MVVELQFERMFKQEYAYHQYHISYCRELIILTYPILIIDLRNYNLLLWMENIEHDICLPINCD